MLGGGRGYDEKVLFEAYVERVLAPSLRAGQVVVMDNLSAHKGERVRQLIEEQGCELLYLPPYSPDLNPIEEAFAKIKAFLCAEPQPVLAKSSSKRWEQPSQQSRLKTPGVSSSTVATVGRFSFCETGCRRAH